MYQCCNINTYRMDFFSLKGRPSFSCTSLCSQAKPYVLECGFKLLELKATWSSQSCINTLHVNRVRNFHFAELSCCRAHITSLAPNLSSSISCEVNEILWCTWIIIMMIVRIQSCVRNYTLREFFSNWSKTLRRSLRKLRLSRKVTLKT